MDKALQRSEQKLLANLIEGLRYIDLQESTSENRSYDSRSITCAENPRYSHVALKVTENGRELFFHRCRNYWYFSTGTNGTNYQLMDMIERFNLPMAGAGLHMIIESLLKVKLKNEILEANPHQDLQEEDASDHKAENDLDTDATYNWLLDLMLRSGSKDDLSTSEFADTLATKWETDTLDALTEGKDAQIGDLWLKKSRTTNKRANQVIKDLQANLPSLRLDGVSDEDILNWWNMPVAKQNLCKVQNNALLRSRIDVRLLALQREGIRDNLAQFALMQALCTVPIFGDSKLSDDGRVESGSPLPWELFSSVMAFFLKDVGENPNWELDAIQQGSYNAYFRSRHSN